MGLLAKVFHSYGNKQPKHAGVDEGGDENK
jgi:hypothetical protein